MWSWFARPSPTAATSTAFASWYSVSWHMLVSGGGLPPGIFLGYLTADFLFGIGTPSWQGMGYGVIIGMFALTTFLLFESVGDLRDAKRIGN